MKYIFHAVKKVIVSAGAHFSDLLQALKLESHLISFKIDTIGSEDQVLTATQAFVIAFPC